MTALIAVEHHPAGLTTGFPAISSAFMVSLLSGENDMAQPLVFLRTGREQRRGTPSACPPDIGHITAPHLIWLGHGELPSR